MDLCFVSQERLKHRPIFAVTIGPIVAEKRQSPHTDLSYLNLLCICASCYIARSSMGLRPQQTGRQPSLAQKSVRRLSEVLGLLCIVVRGLSGPCEQVLVDFQGGC